MATVKGEKEYDSLEPCVKTVCHTRIFAMNHHPVPCDDVARLILQGTRLDYCTLYYVLSTM